MSKLSTKWRPINALNKDLSEMIYPESESTRLASPESKGEGEMITQKELNRISRLHKEIKQETKRLELLRDKAQSPPQMKNGEKVQSSKKGDPMTDIVALVCDLEREVKKDKKELKKLQKKAEELYQIVDGVNREILVLKYSQGESWESIGHVVGYSERHVRRIHYNIIKTVYG